MQELIRGLGFEGMIGREGVVLWLEMVADLNRGGIGGWFGPGLPFSRVGFWVSC